MKEINEKEYAALEILKTMHISIIDAAILAKQAYISGDGKLKQALKCIRIGEETLRKQRKSVTFLQAVETAMEERSTRRPRTIWDFRYYTKRLIRCNRGLERCLIRSLTPLDCEKYLKNAFRTPQQLRKGRAIMSGVFSTALQHEWCSDNPIHRVRTPDVTENRIPILTPEEIRRLLHSAEIFDGGTCLAAVALMLYAGLRPHEVARLTWAQIDLRHNAVVLLPRHTKTGGARRIPIRRPLKYILEQKKETNETSVCPRRWPLKWSELHLFAGWNALNPWCPDILRHTFASYHLQHFQDYHLLQFELGHRDAALIRTRYVDLSNVGDTESFWQEPSPLRAKLFTSEH